MAKFTEIFDDVTKYGKKIPTNEYLSEGKYPIVDQGQNMIAGYTDEKDGVYEDVPAIIFGDHTRILKYVDIPCFFGADGVKLLKEGVSASLLYKSPNPSPIKNDWSSNSFFVVIKPFISSAMILFSSILKS